MNTLNGAFRVTLFASALLVLQILLGTGPVKTADAGNAALDKLIKAAKAEGGTFIAHSILQDVRARNEVEAAMTKMYGFKIKWDYVDFSNQNRFSARLMKELKAGRTPSTDVFNGTQSTIPRLMKANALQRVDNWQELVPRIPKDVIVPGGGAIPEHTRIGGFVYNTSMVPANKVPTKVEHLLDPFWKKKLASTTYAAVWDRASIRKDGTFDTEKAAGIADLLQKLVNKGNIVGLTGCGLEALNRIATGEFAALALICSDNGFRIFQKKGAPVDLAYLDETSNITHSYMGLITNAKYTNMAKLFMVFMQTPEGQGLNRKWDSADTSFYPENLMYKTVKGLEARGVTLPYIDIPTYLKVKPEVEKWKGKYKKILRDPRYFRSKKRK